MRASIRHVTLPIDYSLTGCANGVPVLAKGSGYLDAAEGSLQVTVEGGDMPLHWDPALAILDGLPSLIIEAIRPPTTGDDADLPVLGQTRSVLHDDQGREVGSSVCSFHSHREGDRLVHRAQLLECEARFEALEHITSIDTPHRAIVMPGGVDTRILTHTFSFSSSRGSSYSSAGMTTWRPTSDVLDLPGLTVTAAEFHRTRTPHDQQTLTFEVQFVVDRLEAK